METIKPEVIGYQQVGYNGCRWCETLWSKTLDLSEVIYESRYDLKKTNVKSKFRPVYKKQKSRN